MSIKSFSIAFLFTAATAIACLRPTADRRAIQWSNAIVHARLAKITDPAKEIYSFTVTDSLDGPLTPGQPIQVHPPAAPNPDANCGGHLTADDNGKNYLLLLRSDGKDAYTIVNISSADTVDAISIDAFKELVQETRKAETSLTDDQVKTQALAYANAQDDTEADQAEDTLREMGYKAAPIIQQVMTTASDIGKQRLEGVLKDLIPPGESTPTTHP